MLQLTAPLPRDQPSLRNAHFLRCQPGCCAFSLTTCMWCACVMQEKAALKTQKDAAEAKYKVAYVDGKPEQVTKLAVSSKQQACMWCGCKAGGSC